MKRTSLLLFACLLLLAATLFSSFRKGQPVTGKRFGADTAQLPSFLLAKGYEGKNLVSKSGMMTVSAGLDNELYLLDSGSRTGFLYLEARVDKFVDATVRRNPLNISLVIDRSGSMAGDKIAFAKKAAMDIVDKLLPTDFISIVIYDEYVDVIQKATPGCIKIPSRHALRRSGRGTPPISGAAAIPAMCR